MKLRTYFVWVAGVVAATAAMGSESPQGPAGVGSTTDFFVAQKAVHERDADVQQKERKARAARDEHRLKAEQRKAKAQAWKDRKGRKQKGEKALRQDAESMERRELIEAQRADEEAEIKAELEQIALEEIVLSRVLQENPALAGTVELQRKEIGIRKNMLSLRSSSLPGNVTPVE